MVAGFGTKLLGKPSHEYLTKLLDYEIKLLESIKKVTSAKLKLDIGYGNQLIQLASQNGKFDHPDYESGIFKAWEEILNGFSSQGNAIKKSMDVVQTDVIDKINVLIRDKIAIRKYYVESRERMDNSLIQTIHTELDKKYNNYQKLDGEASAAKRNFETINDKGNARNTAKAADKYRKVTMKLHLSHNAYIVQLFEARSHQNFYRENTLPEFLTGLEDLQVEFTRTIKSALTDYLKQTSPRRQEMIEWQQRCEDVTSYIDPITEYEDFVDRKKSNLELEVKLKFDAVPGEGCSLPPDHVVLNTLTIQGIETTANDLSDDIKQLNEQIEEEKKKLNDLCNDIEKIKQDYNKFSLMSKQLAYSQTEVNKSSLVRIKKTYGEINTYLNATLDRLGDNKPPAGLQLPQFPQSPSHMDSGDYSNKQLGSSMGSKFTQLTGFLSNKISGGSVKSPAIQDKMFDESKPVQMQSWFHGQLSRDDTSLELLDDGDFLLRESKNLRGEMVLSTRHNGEVYHFKINSSSTTGEYMFEGVAYQSIVELIGHYYESQQPITSKRGCILRNAIIRDKWKLSHDNVEILDLLGQGNFGNVHKGYIRSRDQYVAVKTCRESVDVSTRTKFLSEAKILKGYDHPNIVKLIGVATDREPIYIVMELVQGGDLRKYLENEGPSLTKVNLMKICQDACAGLSYLEQKKCIHRDVAARNCLVSDNMVKITDFGMSREEEDGVYNVSGRLRAVPMKWTAPEAMNYGKFTHASDVWSYGILTWEVYSLGDPPYPRMTNQQAREYVERGDRMMQPSRCPQSFYNQVMIPSWSYKPEKRPTFAQLSNIISMLISYEK